MIKKLIKFILISGFIFSLFIVTLGLHFYQFMTSPLHVEKEGYVFLISPGTPVHDIAEKLSKENVLSSRYSFLVLVIAKGAWHQLKAGEYLIKPGTTPVELIEQLREGRVIQHAITIVPGWNFERLMEEINQCPYLSHSLLNLSPSEIMDRLGYSGEHPEGRFYPETYNFPAGTTDIAFLKRAYLHLDQKLNAAWANRSIDLPLKTPYEVLIMASIIEKESSALDEYEEISGVYNRRLQLNMPLQADPTVIYGAGKSYQGRVNDVLLKTLSPYNTYLNRGLPPTPIAMPSQKAIFAAARPKIGETLYFVANPEGTGHVFSKTFAEHLLNVANYRKSLVGKQ